MLGTALIVAGIAGLTVKALHAYSESKDPPVEFRARVAKTRLDTKKEDGKEYYTYIVTFLLEETNRYISLEVSQKQFDETMANDSGILTCNYKRRKFIGWELKTAGK